MPGMITPISFVKFLFTNRTLPFFDGPRTDSHLRTVVDCTRIGFSELSKVLNMQREIESLITAMFTEQKRETELLNDILMAIAVGGAARQRMLQDIAAAATRGEDGDRKEQKFPDHTLQDKLSDLNQAIGALRSRFA